ncbi:leucine zipper putative tumor suppressor 2-like [Bacillus rossius redtenbacheri]|uniref:leucine zipper putative tumor suppressor 2-like n=1 Tax=Bacillus rossius redtenbacheri TaxID=93214 RepID=UPI002FDE6915
MRHGNLAPSPFCEVSAITRMSHVQPGVKLDPGEAARVDSGHETLFSDDSPCDLGATPSSGVGSASSGQGADHTPPKITPFSGVLAKGKVVIRPIAFKPVGGMSPAARFGSGGERYGSTPILARPGSHLTLYGSSSDLRHPHPAGCNYSLDRKFLSSPPLAMASLPSLPSLPVAAGRGFDGSPARARVSSGGGKQFRPGGLLLDPTPSPSDSGLAELEAALRERDAELAYLRQTMEHNEQVIFRVHQEKERVWDRELRRLKAAHESRLRAGAQKALRLEQLLMMQTYQLQQDKKRLREELERASGEAAELRQEVELLRGRLEETEWGLCQKTGEMSLLKAQLKDSQAEQTSKGHELLQLKSQLRDLKLELDRCKEQAEETDRLRADNERLGAELREAARRAEGETGDPGEETTTTTTEDDAVGPGLAAELRRQKEAFERERVTWAQEKEKVLRYQRQLQLGYVQMFHRTRTLESEVESLSAQLQLGSGSARKKQLPAIEMGQTIEL